MAMLHRWSGQGFVLFSSVFALAASLPETGSAQPKSRLGSVTTPDSVRLWYRVVGSGAQTVVIPAALYHRKTFDALAHGRRLVLFDPRGRGLSDTIPPTRASLDHDVSDLETIRRAVAAERMALVGWSGVGLSVFTYALRHPTRVTRLIMLAPLAPRRTPYLDQMLANRRSRIDSAAQVRLDARVAAGEFKGKEPELCREISHLNDSAVFGDPAMARLTPDVCDSPNEWPSRNGPYARAMFASLGDYDWRSEIARVTVPILYVHGDRDTFPLDGSREWAAGRPNARLLVFPRAGHWLQYERPVALIRAMDAFLRGGWPAGSRVVR